MKKTTRFVFGLSIALLGVIFVFHASKDKRGKVLIDPANQRLIASGKALYAAHCAACHGANLEGQPDWRQRLPDGRLPAPPHDDSGHTWHHPDVQLIDIVKNGLVPGRTAPEGYVSNMPAFGNRLTDQEIVAVLAYIKSSWSPEMRQLQEDVTLQRHSR
ncbi:c-type cytochrome [Noviherbaspirillum humi]